MKQLILGTAGHIDHGKTSLIKALTGIDTDRLKEEKLRGITIELGFAHLELPNGDLLGIVDVPGHERFVKNMVAGATGIDIVALIIAADEGVMPQTKEHLEICQLLNIQYGIVVITKIDLVDEEWLELVREDVKEFLSGSFLENAPIIEVSSETGEGLNELIHALESVVKDIPQKEKGPFFRLPVDRVFTIKGFGTVVTGTTISGSIGAGDEITIYPSGIDSKIRGIQVHGKKVNRVDAGMRTAINLQGVEKEQINRGDVIGAKGSLRSTIRIDAEINHLDSSPYPLKNRTKVRFHAGAAEILSSIILLEKEELKPGERGYAQILLDHPSVVLSGDRFILRSYSPVRTIGGGIILNPFAKKRKRMSPDSISELELLKNGSIDDKIITLVNAAGISGINLAQIALSLNRSREDTKDIINQLIIQEKIVPYDPENEIYVHFQFVNQLKERILEELKRYHSEYPLRKGMPKEELRAKTKGYKNDRMFDYLLNKLIQEETLIQENNLIRLKGHGVKLDPQTQKIKKDIETIYIESGLQPPYFRELSGKYPSSNTTEILNLLLEEGTLIKVKEDLYFHRIPLTQLKERLIAYLKNNGEIATSQFKDMTGASRKYAIPLIEYFDKERITVRVGDKRILRKK